MKIATYQDFIKSFAEILADEWQLRNNEPFVNSSDFPSEIGNALIEELCKLQQSKVNK